MWCVARVTLSYLVYTSKEPVCPRVELILKIIIILLIIFLGFIKSKQIFLGFIKSKQTIKMTKNIVPCTGFEP